MPAHSHKLESFTLHLIAVLLLFSVFSTSFLAFGVYQTENNVLTQLNVTVAHASSQWGQYSWSGGTSSEVETTDWSTSGVWAKYNSGTNITVTNLVTANAPGASLVSSVLDVGPTYRAIKFLFGDSIGKTISFRGADSAGGVTSASWSTADSNCILNYRYLQYKVDFASTNQTLSSTGLSTETLSIYGNVKDSSTNQAISGATVSNSLTTQQTAYKQPTSIISPAFAGGGYTSPGSYQFNLDYTVNSPTSYQVTVSKDGYVSQTKTVNLNPVNCTSSVSLDFSLSKNSSSSGSSGGSTPPSSTAAKKSTTTSPTVDTSPVVATATFQTTKLPSLFSDLTAETTDLSKITDPTKIKNFKLSVAGKNKIEFDDTLDLSTQDTVNKLNELDKYVKIDKIGVIEIDSKSLPALNKKAKLTMAGITKFASAPEILVDGKFDTARVVKNISFDNKTGTLKFDVSHFTTFSITPKLELISPKTSTIKSLAEVDLKARISDPTATVSGTFNGKVLSSLKPDKSSGEINIKNITFKKGENVLKLSAQSTLGTVLPLVASINYTPDFLSFENVVRNPLYFTLFLIASLTAIVFALLLGFFVYRKRKREEKTLNPTSSTISS